MDPSGVQHAKRAGENGSHDFLNSPQPDTAKPNPVYFSRWGGGGRRGLDTPERRNPYPDAHLEHGTAQEHDLVSAQGPGAHLGYSRPSKTEVEHLAFGVGISS